MRILLVPTAGNAPCLAPPKQNAGHWALRPCDWGSGHELLQKQPSIDGRGGGIGRVILVVLRIVLIVEVLGGHGAQKGEHDAQTNEQGRLVEGVARQLADVPLRVATATKLVRVQLRDRDP